MVKNNVFTPERSQMAGDTFKAYILYKNKNFYNSSTMKARGTRISDNDSARHAENSKNIKLKLEK